MDHTKSDQSEFLNTKSKSELLYSVHVLLVTVDASNANRSDKTDQ